MYYACFLLQYVYNPTINLFAHSPILATMAICDNYIILAPSPQKFITVRIKKRIFISASLPAYIRYMPELGKNWAVGTYKQLIVVEFHHALTLVQMVQQDQSAESWGFIIKNGYARIQISISLLRPCRFKLAGSACIELKSHDHIHIRRQFPEKCTYHELLKIDSGL